ncbi:hypothetical protein JL107_10710 [Nakamurella flavida]|uniref:Uncharacterized protein n=1 Tax=Nakamurella flavida TaxID=363630 RepID=A0A938YJ38_9ACTN|nr:hypothetical protein [Nakamurella flavida]MBM9476917.1 hypothetical protein [Nakamurella flavida]MDP9779862.1 hypothetical protein [Nakamurella flavida]
MTLPLFVDSEPEEALASAGVVLGPMGTAEKPRQVELPPLGAKIPIYFFIRRTETVSQRSGPASIKSVQKYKRSSSHKGAELMVHFNLWYKDRKTLLNRVRWIDQLANYYVEFYLDQATSTVVFCNEERLKDHGNRGKRVPGLKLREWPSLDFLTEEDFVPMRDVPIREILALPTGDYMFPEGGSVVSPGRHGRDWEPAHVLLEEWSHDIDSQQTVQKFEIGFYRAYDSKGEIGG